jgi:uncharacterized protein YlxW (UPF0749 family)
MIFGIANLLIRLFGWQSEFALRIARIVFLVLASVIIVFVVLLSGRIKSCLIPPSVIKIDEETIQKINSNNERERKAELNRILDNVNATREARDERIEKLNQEIESYHDFKQNVDAETLERLLQESNKQ